MKKNVIPVGYGQRYPSLKKLLCTVPLMAGALLTNTFVAQAAELGSESIASIQQQTITVSGVVMGSDGEPLMGVNVVEKGTTNGTITDLDGKYTLNVGSNAVLQFSYIGYVSSDIAVNGQRTVNVTMKEDSQNLDEVVVVGYGTVRKADLAGSVSVLDNKAFKDQPIKQVSDALQGRVSGVQVQSSGVPGGTVKIRVRGSGSINRSNDPLYVIDGIVRESGLTGLNPDDIQSMQILKDASSTAIYGSRGANGVVLITTKTGKANTRQITFDAQVTAGTVAKRYDTLNAYEFATLYNTYRANTFSSDQLSAFQRGGGTNWQDEIFQTGITQDYKVTFSGGSDKTQYIVSGNYVGQEGVVIENDNKRYQARANVTSQITDWLHMTADVNASHNVRHSGDFSAAKSNIVTQAMNYSPVTSIFNEDGMTYARDKYSSLTNFNPVGRLKEEMGETMQDIVNAHVDLRFNILPGLTFTTSNGIDYSDAKGYSFGTKKVGSQSSMGNSDAYRMTLQTTNNLTYTGKWDKHALTATAVYEATQSEYRYMGLNGRDLLTESVGWWNVNMASSRTTDNSYSKWGLVSGVARVMYNYDDRYMLTGTFRADGSSKFFNDKWGYFPSVAAAWTITNEEFMKDQNVVQDMKIRASYGLIGS